MRPIDFQTLTAGDLDASAHYLTVIRGSDPGDEAKINATELALKLQDLFTDIPQASVTDLVTDLAALASGIAALAPGGADGDIQRKSGTGFAGGSFFTADGTTVTYTRDAIGTGATLGFLMRNTTAAANGAQQYSPMFVQSGSGWKTTATAASQSVSFATQVRPEQGTTAPTGALTFLGDINGGGYTFKMSLNSWGRLQVNDSTAGIANGNTGLENSLRVFGNFVTTNQIHGITNQTTQYGWPNLEALTGFFQNNTFQYGIVYSGVGNNSFGLWQIISKSRSTTGNTYTTVVNNDELASFWFQADNGVFLVDAARIEVRVDGTWTGNNVPTRMTFYTRLASGSMSARLSILNNGFITVGSTTPTTASGKFHLRTDASGNIGFISQGASGQSVSLYEARDNTGAVLWSITGGGHSSYGEAINLIFGTTTGTKIGTSQSQKIGFYNATPIVQAVLATGAGASVDDVITALQNLGLVRQS